MDGSRLDDDNESLSENESLFRILLATDIHLGCFERDPVRANDSFVAFEEILQYARDEKVDMLLLGGDLFHENKPSRQSIQRCMDLLRKYCLGEEEVKFEFLSDPEIIFRDCSTPGVNIEDPNLQIALPIFTINGNHDDPCGEGNYSIMDMLAASGFVNYFGKTSSVKELRIQPLLLRKGDTCLAIYGLGSMNDDRLCRLFNEEKVAFERPAENEDDWFNLMVIHQNRSRHGAMNYVPEQILPDFFQLVFWGHEHECRLEPETAGNYFITQPGSSVVTALSPGEAVPKHVGVLNVKQKEFYIDALPLKTSRPFVFDSLTLNEVEDDGIPGTASKKVFEMAARKVEEMINESKRKITGHAAQPHLPLIRLRVEYENKDQMFNLKEFEVKLQLEKRVANPEEVIRFARKRAANEKLTTEIDQEAWLATLNLGQVSFMNDQLEDLLVKYYENTKKPLSLLHEKSLALAVHYYVEKEHNEAFHDIVGYEVQKSKEKIKELKPENREQFREYLNGYRDERNGDQQQITAEAEAVLKGEIKVDPSLPSEILADRLTMEVDGDGGPSSPTPITAPPTAARGRARGRGSRAATASTPRAPRARASTRGRGSRSSAVDDVITLDSDDEPAAEPAARRGRGRAASSSARRPPGNATIGAAFARQSQVAAAASSSVQSSARSSRSSSSTARGKLYVSDSD